MREKCKVENGKREKTSLGCYGQWGKEAREFRTRYNRLVMCNIRELREEVRSYKGQMRKGDKREISGSSRLGFLESEELLEATNDLRHRRSFRVLLVPHLTHEFDNLPAPSSVESGE